MDKNKISQFLYHYSIVISVLLHKLMMNTMIDKPNLKSVQTD